MKGLAYLPGIVAIVVAYILSSFRNSYDINVIQNIVKYRDEIPFIDKEMSFYMNVAIIQEYRHLILVGGIMWVVILTLIFTWRRTNNEKI